MNEEAVGKPILVGDASSPTQVEILNSALGKRRLIRAVKNPLDKCTIVSIFPKNLEEVKPTIEPGVFKIPAGSVEKPGVLVIGSSSWWKDIDFEQPMVEMVQGSIQVAESVVKDYCNSMLGSNMNDSMPGLFYVIGSKTSVEIVKEYKNKLDEMNIKQNKWYSMLIRLADSLWARTNGNPLVIWDDMRLAARQLNLNDKPWLRDFQMAQLIPCKACGTMKNPTYPVCPACKAIDNEHPTAKELKFAV